MATYLCMHTQVSSHCNQFCGLTQGSVYLCLSRITTAFVTTITNSTTYIRLDDLKAKLL